MSYTKNTFEKLFFYWTEFENSVKVLYKVWDAHVTVLWDFDTM